MRDPAADRLPRAIGRLALLGLTLNAIIGSSVFGLPSVIGGRLGAMSPWAWVLAALGMALVIACFAEVASRFDEAGGAYLYTRVAVGRLAAIEMGWMSYLVRLTAAATNANLFVISLASFWPPATGPLAAPLVLALVLTPLAAANYRGIGPGVGVSSAFTVAKLVPLALFLAAGALLVGGGRVDAAASEAPVLGAGDWLNAVLLLVFAYGGFEAALFPLGEAKDPRRDAPLALFVALGVCAVLYTSVQAVVVRVLPDPASHSRPLADAAGILLGPWGTTVLALAAMISTYGYLAGAMVNAPRLTFAMAEQGDLPAPLAAPHPVHRTPHRSIVLFAALSWLLASSGSFLSNLSLSAVSRLVTYGGVCAVLLVLRHREAEGRPLAPPARLAIPAGRLVAWLGLGFSCLLVIRMTGAEALVLAVTMLAGAAHWWVARGGRPARPE